LLAEDALGGGLGARGVARRAVIRLTASSMAWAMRTTSSSNVVHGLQIHDASRLQY
jgi:hypothetical protein